MLTWLEERVVASKGLTCPRCGERQAAPLIWGDPVLEVAEAASRDQIVLGGCLIPSNPPPDVVCRYCGLEWVTTSHRWACFGVGLNNFATGRVRFGEIRSLVAADPDLEVAAAFGATGNLIIDSALSPDEIEVRLHALCVQATNISHPWAAISLERYERYADETGKAPEPPSGDGFRWTRGLAFPVQAPQGSILADTSRARLRWTSDRRSVIVFKRDAVDDRGRLDRTRRGGGWGAISADLRKQVNGVWTARSLRTVKGLLEADRAP